MYMDSKTSIHPAQTAVRSPDETTPAVARRIVVAFEVPGAGEIGVPSVDGRTAERLHLGMTRCTLAPTMRLDDGGTPAR